MSDGRRARGDRTRAAVARRAADVASVDGLAGLSIGGLARDLGLSKSGVATVFGSKEQLQLAAIEVAAEVFRDAVVSAASDVTAGLARLDVLVERWLAYVTEPTFPGGCFWGENLPAADAHPGAVRDALAAQHRAWVALLEQEVRHALDLGEIHDVDPPTAAFLVDAALAAANVALRLGDASALATVRRGIDAILGRPRHPSG